MGPADRNHRASKALFGLGALLVIVACSAQGQGAWRAPPTEREEWGLAREASNAGRWEEAAGRWHEIFMRHGQDWEVACAETARALCQLRDHGSAQGVLALGLRLSPGDAGLLETNGNILAERGFRRAAEQCYLQALEASPERASALLALGRLRLELGLEESAREPLRKRLALGHEDAETHWLLAEATRRSGDAAAALSNYRRAFELGDQPAHKLVFAASLYLNGQAQKRNPHVRELAVSWLVEAIEKDPQNTEAHYYLALAHLDAERGDEAVRSLRRAVETDPTHVPALTRLARLHADRGEMESARQMAERALPMIEDEGRRRMLEELLVTAEQRQRSPPDPHK